MNGFLDAVEGMVFLDQRIDAEFLDRLAGRAPTPAARWQSRRSASRQALMVSLRICAAVKSISTMPVASSTIRRGGCAEDCSSASHVAPEMIGIEKRQRRLEAGDNDIGLGLAGNVRIGRPPDRGARHPLITP